LAHCIDGCVDDARRLTLFGSLIYSSDSSICLAAYHAGAIGGKGGDVEILVERGEMNY